MPGLLIWIIDGSFLCPIDLKGLSGLDPLPAACAASFARRHCRLLFNASQDAGQDAGQRGGQPQRTPVAGGEVGEGLPGPPDHGQGAAQAITGQILVVVGRQR